MIINYSDIKSIKKSKRAYKTQKAWVEALLGIGESGNPLIHEILPRFLGNESEERSANLLAVFEAAIEGVNPSFFPSILMATDCDNTPFSYNLMARSPEIFAKMLGKLSPETLPPVLEQMEADGGGDNSKKNRLSSINFIFRDPCGYKEVLRAIAQVLPKNLFRDILNGWMGPSGSLRQEVDVLKVMRDAFPRPPKPAKGLIEIEVDRLYKTLSTGGGRASAADPVKHRSKFGTRDDDDILSTGGGRTRGTRSCFQMRELI